MLCLTEHIVVRVCACARFAGDHSSSQPRLLPATSAAAAFACRSGALLLAHALFPDHTRGWLGWLAVPVAVADGLDALHSAVPQPARAAVAARASKLRDSLQGRGSKRSSSSSSSSKCSSSEGEEWSSGVGWVDGTGGVVKGSLHALRCLSGEGAATAAAPAATPVAAPAAVPVAAPAAAPASSCSKTVAYVGGSQHAVVWGLAVACAAHAACG
jgi:hypothetical protein